MELHAALAATATLVSTAFALCTLERWLDRRKPHELMWTIALAFFALGSLALWAGAATGWSEWTFKAFYLFGAILNVPVLALGTVHLLARKRTADITTAAVALLCAFAAGVVLASPLTQEIHDPAVLPNGRDVAGIGSRVFAAVGSGVASLVIIAGALWSAWRLAMVRRRQRRAENVVTVASSVSAGRLALANVVIAAGTFVSAGAGVLNSVLDAMDAFAVTLVAGIAIIFVGFLLTSPTGQRRAARTDVRPWYPPGAEPAPGDAVAARRSARSG